MIPGPPVSATFRFLYLGSSLGTYLSGFGVALSFGSLCPALSFWSGFLLALFSDDLVNHRHRDIVGWVRGQTMNVGSALEREILGSAPL